MTSFIHRGVLLIGTALIGLVLSVNASAQQVRIIQTNSRGENAHIIDPATNRIVGEITGVPIPHGAAVSPDGRTYYLSSETVDAVHVADATTLTITKKIPITGRANNITISKDGRWVYVGIAAAPGAIDVIDTQSLTKVRTIPMKGGIHNVYVTPDGKYIVAGSIAGKVMTVLDQATEQPVWTLFDVGVRPIAFETNPDGSTKRLFVQLSDVHGFAIVDFAQRKEVGRIALPADVPPENVDWGPYYASPSHGLGVAPDNRTLWVTSRAHARVYVYSLPDLRLMGAAPLGGRPDWVTFTPDSKQVYIAVENIDRVIVFDVPSMKEVARIPAGLGPQRNVTAVMR